MKIILLACFIASPSWANPPATPFTWSNLSSPKWLAQCSSDKTKPCEIEKDCRADPVCTEHVRVTIYPRTLNEASTIPLCNNFSDRETCVYLLDARGGGERARCIAPISEGPIICRREKDGPQ